MTASQETWKLRRKLDESYIPSATLEKAYMDRMEADEQRFFEAR